MRITLSILLLLSSVAAWSADCVETTIPGKDQITITAKTGEYAPPELGFKDNVKFQQGKKILRAEEVWYNIQDKSGKLSNASFTTCDRENPDYRITARDITLTSDQMLKARHVSVYLWKTKLFTIPRLSMNVGPGSHNQSLIPSPGYGKYEGFFLNMKYDLLSSQKGDAKTFLRPTTKNGIQAGLTGGYAFEGDTRITPPYYPDFDSDLRYESVLQPVINDWDWETGFPDISCKPRLVSMFGGLVSRQRTFDVDEPNLLVSRLPEVGFRYVSPETWVSPRDPFSEFGVQTQFRTSWGRFKDSSEGDTINRFDARGIASTTLARFGKSTALRASGLARISEYGNGDHYGVLGGALDVSKIFPSGSYLSLRYMAHGTSGQTPFEFDDIDIPFELMGSASVVWDNNRVSGLIDYDVSDASIRSWTVTYARRLHCIEPSISWKNTYKEISLNVRILGL